VPVGDVPASRRLVERCITVGMAMGLAMALAVGTFRCGFLTWVLKELWQLAEKGVSCIPRLRQKYWLWVGLRHVRFRWFLS